MEGRVSKMPKLNEMRSFKSLFMFRLLAGSSSGSPALDLSAAELEI